jgi:hypothetical protein
LERDALFGAEVTTPSEDQVDKYVHLDDQVEVVAAIGKPS